MTVDRESGRAKIDYKKLVERSIQGILLLGRQGIAFANQALGEISGYTVEELQSFSVEEVIGLVHPDDRQMVKERIANRLRGEQEPDRYELRFIHKSGAVKWLELQSVSVVRDGEPLVQAHALDLTERVRAERELKRSESRLKAAIESLPFDFYALDLEGRYVLQNSICRQHGGDVIGKTPGEVDADPATIALWESNNKRAYSGETVAEEVQFQTGGKQRTCYNIITPVFDDAEIIGIQGVNIDITELRRAQEEKAEMERQLLHSQKMEAVGTLAGGVAHDFNNLLMCIIGNVDLIKQRQGRGQRVGEANIEVIESAALRASALTRQLLNFARSDAVEHVPVNLAQLVDETISLIEHTFDKDIVIEAKLSAIEPIVLGDTGQLQQVLVNLAVNARDAMPDGGTLSFNVQEPNAGRQLKIVVSDTGSGIPVRVRERMFEPFFTTKEPGRGTGMGLAVAYSIIESHGGTIEIESEEGKGTQFEISLPLYDEETPVQTEISPSVKEEATQGVILLVEDDEGVRTVVSEQLVTLGQEVIYARNGLEAVNIYREQGRKIDLILLDIAMPVMGGVECQMEIRKIDPEARIVVMTGQLTGEVNHQLASQGVLAVLKKPFVIRDLKDVLTAALDR